MSALIVPPSPALTSAGETQKTSTHHWVGVDRAGTIVAEMDAAKVVRSRKEGEDDLGTGGSTTIDFDALLYDNKRYALNASATLTLTATRGGWYSLKLKSSAAAQRDITWAYGGGDALAPNHYWPTFVDVTENVVIKAYYSDGLWFPKPVKTRQRTYVATGMPDLWTPDAANGLYLEWVVTGVAPGAPVKELQVPANLPLNETMIIHFQSNQTNGLNFSDTFAKLGVRPNFDGKTTLGIHRNSDGYQIRGLDVETWADF